jgi:hypothetical protein
MQKLKRLETPLCPFANLPEKKRTQWALTRDKMKNCVWLQPDVVAQVEALQLGIGRELLTYRLRVFSSGRSLDPWPRVGTSRRGGGRLSDN